MAPSRGPQPLARTQHVVLDSHRGAVNVARYSKGSAKYVLTGGQDRTVRLWNPSLGTEVKASVPHSNKQNNYNQELAFSSLAGYVLYISISSLSYIFSSHYFVCSQLFNALKLWNGLMTLWSAAAPSTQTFTLLVHRWFMIVHMFLFISSCKNYLSDDNIITSLSSWISFIVDWLT